MAEEKTQIPGDFVVAQLIDDVLLADQALRNCIDNISTADENSKEIIFGFVHYVIARPVGLSDCSKADADHILSDLLDVLMTTAPGLDYALVKSTTVPTLHDVLSGRDPANTHIRTSTAFCLEALQKGGLRISDDDKKLALLLYVAESLQVEVKVFLDTLLKQHRFSWEKRSGELTEAERGQAREIVGLRKLLREEYQRRHG